MKQLYFFLAALCCAATIYAADDVVPGKFTINADGDQVQFARGNLQAIGTGDPSSWTWRFAENQWDYAGKENHNNSLIKPNSAGYPGAVYDLFGWSTDQTYYGLNLSTSNSDYSGEFVDWGNLMGEGWRTLTYDEWKYIWNRRKNALGLRGIARIYNGVSDDYVNGLILLPDDADVKDLGFAPNSTSWTANSLDSNSKVMKVGAVFLPAAGLRGAIIVNDVPIGMDVYQVSNTCYYWASTPCGEEYASAMHATREHAQTNLNVDRFYGLSVRLVKDVVNTEGVDQITNDKCQMTNKVIKDGRFLILRGDKTFTLQGQEVK